jgi:hypothetical protein
MLSLIVFDTDLLTVRTSRVHSCSGSGIYLRSSPYFDMRDGGA